MRSIKFRHGEASPFVFVNVELGLAASVHGDDFTTTRPKCKIDWFEFKLEPKYKLKKVVRLGQGLTMSKS